jgi:hypothetical protein
MRTPSDVIEYLPVVCAAPDKGAMLINPAQTGLIRA